MRRSTGLFASFALVIGGAACSSRVDERPRLELAVTQFYDAMEAEDGEAACELLAPETRHQLEESEKTACSEAITETDLPELGTPTEINVYGDEGRVVADGDTVFAADFDDAWRIVAAGCDARGDLPQDCELEGG